DTPVIDWATFLNSRWTPLVKTSSSRFSAVSVLTMRSAPSVSFDHTRTRALLRGVGLDHADTTQRLVEPPGHLRVDLAALAEERPQLVEGDGHRRTEGADHDDVEQRQDPG